MSELIYACIIPTWNSADVVEKCLQSIANQTRAFDEIIVVDNGSKDETCAIAHQFAFSKVIELPTNRGFAAAINLGIRISTANIIVWLNADAYLDKSFLNSLDHAVQSNPEHSLFVPKILFPKKSAKDVNRCIENVGNYFWIDGLNWCVGRGEIDCGQYDNNYSPIFPSGAVCAIRSSLTDSIGLLDEGFFSYGEDADFGLRAFLSGHRSLFVPEARASHSLSHSFGFSSQKKVYLVERNRILIVWKNFPFCLLINSFPFSVIRYLLWFFALKQTSRILPTFEHLGRMKILFLIFHAHLDAIMLIVRGTIIRRTILKGSIGFIKLVRPFLLSLRDLFST